MDKAKKNIYFKNIFFIGILKIIIITTKRSNKILRILKDPQYLKHRY